MGLRTLRGRIGLLSLLLTASLVAAAVYIQALADDSAERSRQLSERQREFDGHLGSLKTALYAVEGGLYQYAVLLDDSQRAAVEKAAARMGEHAGHMVHSPLARGDGQLADLAARVAMSADELGRESHHLLHSLSDPRTRFPASAVVTDALYPSNRRFSTSVEDAIADVQTYPSGPLRDELMELLYQLRFYWVRQTGAARIYMASRSGVFGAHAETMREQVSNRGNYAELSRDMLNRLAVLNEQHGLGLRFSIALDNMIAARTDYEAAFREVVKIYETEGWRADIPFFRERIKPLLGRLWSDVRQIEQRLASLSSDTLMESLDTTGAISWFLWLVTGVATLFLALVFLSYEYVIHRPIEQVTGALQALSKGSSYTPLVKTFARETEGMLTAFREMQNEVQSREARLRAILDNASDGIITTDSQGVITTFNNAAQWLFGYSADEAIGQNVSILMPPSLSEQHGRFMRDYLGGDEEQVLGKEVNVNARRRDGSVFPISIKLSEMTLDGERYYTAIVSDISERKAMMDHLRKLAEEDALTELYNRQYFLQELERVVERAQRQGGLDCALLYVDLDNFKYVNDTLGHLAGDRVLVEVASLIRNRSRKGDVIARLGGDEFALLLFDVDLEQARAAAENYRRRMVDYAFRHEGRIIDIGCSIGVAMLTRDIRTREDLMARADLSCHMAKRAGRNCVHMYRADDQRSVENMSADMGWARHIKAAIEQNRFDFALQPIVNVQSRRPVAREVLLRMLDGDQSPIMPSGFLPSAERFGLMLDIDRWVIAHAIYLLALQENREERFAINLSATSMSDTELLDHITGVLKFHEVDPTRLTFEITETVAIADLDAAMRLLNSLRALGCKTALDDFGAGYSSFAYLKDLPVDYVKIDGSFVRGIDRDPLHLAMVKSMNEIAHAMGKQTVAEFVDSERVLQRLREIGIDHVQGYYVGLPELVCYPSILDRDKQTAPELLPSPARKGSGTGA